MTVDPDAREALERVLDRYLGKCPTGSLLDDLYRAIIPPNAVVVQTEGEEWEAMVERTAASFAGVPPSHREFYEEYIEDARAALCAAFTPPKQEEGGDGA